MAWTVDKVKCEHPEQKLLFVLDKQAGYHCKQIVYQCTVCKEVIVNDFK